MTDLETDAPDKPMCDLGCPQGDCLYECWRFDPASELYSPAINGEGEQKAACNRTVTPKPDVTERLHDGAESPRTCECGHEASAHAMQTISTPCGEGGCGCNRFRPDAATRAWMDEHTIETPVDAGPAGTA